MLASFTNHEMCNPLMQEYAYEAEHSRSGSACSFELPAEEVIKAN